MNTNQITKILTLLNENKTKEAKEELTKILLNKTDKTKANILKTIESYLKESKKINESRPVLNTIQHQNGKQFILNGFSAFLFKNYIKELDELENTNNEANCIDIFKIINKLPEYKTINENDLILLKNIKKYIAYYKSQENYKKNEMITIYFNNKIFNTKMIKQVADIMEKDLNCLQITTSNGELNPTQIENADILALILPVRTPEDEKNKTILITNNFINELKGN